MRTSRTLLAQALWIRLPVLVLLALALTGAAGCAGVRWNFDYAQAQRQARQQNQPILLYFWDWLSIDRSRMDSEVWSDPRVVAETRRTIVVPLEQGWFPDLVKQYQVDSAPTLILLSPDGVEKARLHGVPTPEQFVSWLRTGLARPAPATTQAAVTQPVAP